jgi:hypothetical protein
MDLLSELEVMAQSVDVDEDTHPYHNMSLSLPEIDLLNRVPNRSYRDKARYLFKLEGPLQTAGAVQEAAGLLDMPVRYKATATDEAGELSTFVSIDQRSMNLIARRFPNTQLTFIRVSVAEKCLNDFSLYPTLGIDTTLPQFRPAQDSHQPSPKQDEYPVWYFFYGTLADQSRLMSLLDLSVAPQLIEATVKGGQMKTWGGKYKALVNETDSGAEVSGSAYQVMSKEHEEALRLYETDKYEVVRCDIWLGNLDGTTEAVKGLTFRFRDDNDLDWCNR